MKVALPVLLSLLAACSSSTEPSAPPPVDYRVQINTGGSEIGPTGIWFSLSAVVQLPGGGFAHDVTVKWEADTGGFASQSTTGPDSAANNTWSLPAPNPAPYDAHMRACATDPVSRVCTVYSGTVTVHME